MKIFDTHSHYDDSRFDEICGTDRVGYIRGLIDNAGVLGMVGVGVDIESSARQLRLASEVDGFYAACGFHPENLVPDDDIEKKLAELEQMLRSPKAVAIGEIGLDYYWEENPPKDVQLLWFEKQLELSKKLDLPVIVHDREAHGDCFDAICRHKGTRGVFHSYSGSIEMARELIKRDYIVSFTGVVTFKNATRVAEVVRQIPLECMMIETDCPYMAPVPMRGKINHSGYLVHIASKIAEIKNIDLDELVDILNNNAKKFFGI